VNIILRFKKALQRRLFYLFNVKNFGSLAYKATIEEPNKMEGVEYIQIDDYVFIQSYSWLLALKQEKRTPVIKLSSGVTIGRFSHIVAVQKVFIEENVLIADKVYISDNIHEYENIDMPIKNQPIKFKKEVIIGKNSWIGENVSIIGVSVGKHCVIGANSVVTHDIPDYSVAVGSPARVIKRYNFFNNKWENVE